MKEVTPDQAANMFFAVVALMMITVIGTALFAGLHPEWSELKAFLVVGSGLVVWLPSFVYYLKKSNL
ncbi:MAG TPA: hypothetical protein PL051_02635 [Candidatus Saccharibacteria bacterium]|nr:hypothetical protein [Candidatus Saccharibacteria bacterium]